MLSTTILSSFSSSNNSKELLRNAAPFIIMSIAVILIITIIAISNSSQKRKRQEQALAIEAATALEEMQKASKIHNIQSNPTICKWATEVTETLYSIISNSPHRDWEFDFRPYRQDFAVGIHLQNIYYKNLQKMSDHAGQKFFHIYNFSENQLPELTENDFHIFSKAFAQMVQGLLAQKDIQTTISDKLTTVSHEGSMLENFEDRNIHCLKYKRKTVEGHW